MTQMSQSAPEKQTTHAHQLLNLIGEQPAPMTLTEIHDLAVAHFGEAVHFHTCRLQDQSLDQILKFFVKMEKIIEQEQGYVLNRTNVCSH